MKIKLFWACVIIFLAITKSYAQHSSIKGKILDAVNKLPIQYATIALFKANDSTLVTGNIAGNKGDFQILNIGPGSYHLSVMFLGYETKYLRNIIITQDQDLYLGNIDLNPLAKMLNEVSVAGKKASAINKIDKQRAIAQVSLNRPKGARLSMLLKICLRYR